MSITAKVKYLKSVLRFLVVFTVLSASVTWCQSEEGILAAITSYESISDSNQYILSNILETNTHQNENNNWNPAEPFIDRNKNSVYDDHENFQDRNNNGIWDDHEPFTDLGNTEYDDGEEFIDINGNKIRDLNLWYVDANKNGKWDKGDPFEDLNDDGKKSFKETYTDINNNNRYDSPERAENYKFSYNAKVISEPFIDAPNGRYDLGEDYIDENNDDKWTPAEEYDDLDGNGRWTPAEEYDDLNGDGKWTPAGEYMVLKSVIKESFVDSSEKSGDSELKISAEIINSKKFNLRDEKLFVYEDVNDQWAPAKYYPLLPQLVDPFPPQVKTLSIKSSHPFWNGHSIGKVVSSVSATKKLRKIKQDNEAGLINGTIIIYHRYGDVDLQMPAVVTIDWYKPRALKENAYNEFRNNFIKNLTKKTRRGSGGPGSGFSIINTQIGETDVELNISGNINVSGALVFEEKDLVTTNLKESKSWDLEIEQTQRFNIDGNIGDRIFVKIKQDSEADFTWENDLTIQYKGHKNDIIQKAEAGNINLSLEGMDAVNLGGANSSLFGLKIVNQLGPVELQSVVAREQVKKSEKTMEGGVESGTPVSINDYGFVSDRYFFIDDRFKNNYYPLNETNQHTYEDKYVLGKFELFQKSDNNDDAAFAIQAEAYLDPTDSLSHKVGGNWLKLEENIDYEIDRLLGWVRLNSVQNAIAIAYTTTTFDPINQTFGQEQNEMGTDFKSVYDDCVENPEIDQQECVGLITLKLLKAKQSSTPTSPTWPLMFKNVYSLGGSNIEPSGLDLEIVRDLGGGDERTHSESGNSWLSIFGLDSENENHQKVEGGDGKIDLYGSLLNLTYGELILPTYLPFAYDNKPRVVIDEYNNTFEINDENGNSTYWGKNHIDLQGVLEVELNDADGDFSDSLDTGPAMYYDTNQDNINSEHEFVIKVKTSSRSSFLDLGFMIVEGSETVRLGGDVLQKDVDYTIDYFSGTINFINPAALDPTAEISVSYEENEFISFDQKFLAGTHFKYAFGERNYLAGGMFYYKQSIADEKVDIGYEPMQNFVWNIKGKYQNEWGFLTRAVDYLPFIETTKTSVFSIEGNYAEINPNPNPLGQAFIDDFESAKRTSSFSIMMRQWKMASPPEASTHTVENRGKMIWYNPYEDELTKNIWPEQSTSTRANNNTTKTLHLQTDFRGASDSSSFWNGIMIPLYTSEHDQSLSKYLDIWVNANEVNDDSFKIHIDIGHISEDWNNNTILDTEDEPVYGPGMGDGILSDGEDVGVDNCTNSYENGWGGCLCDAYDKAIYDSDLNSINSQSNPAATDRNGKALKEYCIDPEAVRYDDALDIDSIFVNLNTNSEDPNRDNWCYNTSGCSETSDYTRANGTEGNGQAMGYRYPDSEDLDKNNTLDTQNDYFTFSFAPKDTIMMVNETENNDGKTGWKLFRIPKTGFDEEGDPKWNDVPTFRIRLESADSTTQKLMIAKIELVENDWLEMGVAQKDTLNEFKEDQYFSVSVINTDESSEYKSSLDALDIVLEHDDYNDIDMKEQSLVISFEADSLASDNKGGIAGNHAVLIKNTFTSLGDKAKSYFTYEKMEMFVYGGDPEANPDCNWYESDGNSCAEDSTEVDFLFRIGKDGNNYYEIRQPVYKKWNDKNHIDINIDKLTQLKIPTIESPAEDLDDVGIDGFLSDYENGCVGMNNNLFGGGFELYKYDRILDSLNISADTLNQEIYIFEESDTLIVCGQIWWDNQNCVICSEDDPNGDNFHEDNNPEGTEENEKFDQLDINGDGLISNGEAEPAKEDHNGDGIYTRHPSYDYENGLYVWDNPVDIVDACGNCSQLQIKGTPSINNIQTIVMGVINKSSERIYGKVLVNELRMTGVKKRRGRSYSVSGSLDFADLMTISGNYKKKDSEFHKLQQRLGGDSEESYSATIKLHPNIMLPTRWGIKTPITLGYTNSEATPKYHPGSDILTDSENDNFDIKELQTINEKISFSTSFNKSTRSSNWLLKRTVDNISLNFSAIQTNKSTNQIFNETKDNYETSASYSYTFGKENYLSPFAFTKDWILIGSILGEARYYYMPDKFSASINFSENSTWKIQRVNLKTETTDDDTTKSYSFNMGRKFTLNHKFTKSFSSNYTKQIDSNFPEEEFRYNKWKIIEDMNPGLVKAVSEKLTNTFSPEFIKWLNPTITYNPTYNWNLNIIDTLTTANVKSSNSFKTKIGLSLQDLVELVYTPENKGKSSKSRGRGRGRSSSSNKNKKKFNVKNPALRFMLGGVYTLVSKLNKISATYTYTTSHDYNNISSDLSTSYFYRLGIQKSPVNTSSEVLFNDELIADNNLVGSSSSSYGNDLNVSSSINLTRSIVTSMDFKYSNSLSLPSTASRTKNESFSFYPLGTRGDEGIPITNWSVNWSGIEKWWFMNKLFKSVTLSHGFNGERSMSSKDENNDGFISDDELQNEQYSFNYSPILGITTKTKGKSPITFKVNYNLNQTIKKIDESTERNHGSQISSSISFKKSGGLTIPVFFFRDFYISNDLDFALNFNWDTDRKLMTSTVVDDLAEFNEQSKNTSWSLKPNVNVSFTRWVSGNFYFVYGISENKTTGKNEEKDFGFNVNIKIQG